MHSDRIRESFGLSHGAIASTDTALCSPKIKVDVIGLRPRASSKGFGLSSTIVFPRAVKTFTFSEVEAVCSNPFLRSIGISSSSAHLSRIACGGPR